MSDPAVLEKLRQVPQPDFARALLRIVDKDGETVPLDNSDRPGQQKLAAKVQEMEDAGVPVRIILVKSRQFGGSTWIQGELQKRAITVARRKILIVAQDMDTAGSLFAMGQLMHEELPAEIRPPVASFNNPARGTKVVVYGEKVGMSVTGLNSRIQIDTAAEVAGGRGRTYTDLHLSECAHWQDSLKALSLLPAVPKRPGTSIFLESTANGMNWFHQRAKDAMVGQGSFELVFVGWHEDPDCTREFTTPAQREAFVETIGDVKASPFAEEEPWLVEEFDCTPEQLYFRRTAIVDECEGKVELFKQEYPACLTGEVRVSTDLGLIPIREAGSAMVTESGRVQAWQEQVPSQIYKLTTADGRVIRGTHDHPIARPDGTFVWLSELQPGDEIQLRSPRFAAREHFKRWHPIPGVSHSVRVDEDWGRWLGYFMGDGSWHSGSTVSFTCDAKDVDVVEDVAGLTTRLIGEPRRRTISRVKGRKGCVELRLGAMPAKDALVALGAIAQDPRGRFKRKVCVPEVIWRSPRHVVREFLRGLFEADGSASMNRVRWASAKEDFAREVQLLLLGFGINAAINERRKTAGSGHEYVSYTLELNSEDSIRFHDRIGFVSERKSSLRPTPSNGDKRRPPARSMTDVVAQVEVDGIESTWDFTIDNPEHVFTANGILTHNTVTEAFIGSGRQVFSIVFTQRALKQAEFWESQPAELGGPQRGLFVGSNVEVRQLLDGTIKVPRSVEWVPEDRITGRCEWWPGQFHDPKDPLWTLWLPADRSAEEWRLAQERGEVDLDQMEQGMARSLLGPGQYVIAGDPADDIENNSPSERDEHAFNALIGIDHRTGVQVAEFHARMDHDLVARHAYLCAVFLNRAWLSIEQTGGYGNTMLQLLHKYFGYPMVYQRKKLDTKAQKASDVLGWSTDRASKPQMEATAQALLREESHGIRSPGLALELTTYVKDEKNHKRHEPAPGSFSDRLMAWMQAQEIRRLKPIRQVQAGQGPVSSITRRFGG